LLLTTGLSSFYKGQAQTLGAQVIGAAGGTSKAVSGYTIDFTVGETVIVTGGTNPSCTQGFQQPSTVKDFPKDSTQGPGWYIKVYPNPIHSLLEIHALMDLAGDLDLRLIDMQGRVLLVRRLSFLKGVNDATVYVGWLARGVYVLYFADRLHGGHREVKLLKE
jgi:hypothetical protein